MFTSFLLLVAMGGSSSPVFADETPILVVQEETQLFELINEYRESLNLEPLALCRSLTRAARKYSLRMRDENFFDHTDPDGMILPQRACEGGFQRACSRTTLLGENLAAGNRDAKKTFEQLKASEPHRRQMIQPNFHFMGLGRAVGGGEYGVYWTQIFARDGEPSCL